MTVLIAPHLFLKTYHHAPAMKVIVLINAGSVNSITTKKNMDGHAIRMGGMGGDGTHAQEWVQNTKEMNISIETQHLARCV